MTDRRTSTGRAFGRECEELVLQARGVINDEILEGLLADDPSGLQAWCHLLRVNQDAKRRDAVIENLQAIIKVAPQSLRERLLLGRLLEQRGLTGEAGRQVDHCLETLSQSNPPDHRVINQLLKSIQIGPDARVSMRRFEAFLSALDQFTQLDRPVARTAAIAQCQILLALRNQAAYFVAVAAALLRYPHNQKLKYMDELAMRWRSERFPHASAEKIFVIGLSRTGTSSIHNALAALGFRSVHWENPLTFGVLDSFDYSLFDAFSDISVSAEFESLHYRFPSARFIWTRRPIDAWVRSVANHYENATGVTRPAQLLQSGRAQLFGGRLGAIHASLYGNHESWEATYAAYEQRVSSFFADKPEAKLLEISITEGEGWEAISAFLEVPSPETPFPHLNLGSRKLHRHEL